MTKKDAIPEPKGGLTRDEKQQVKESTGLRAATIYEIIRREGESELVRSANALWWSGLAAGISIGFSFLTEALLIAYLPDAPWRPLVENWGYCVGFIIVIMAHQQLFTENTITAVLPVMMRRQWVWTSALLRLWLIVLIANVVGCLLFALAMTHGNILSPAVQTASMHIVDHMMANSQWQMFTKGIVAGWLIAVLVWMLPAAKEAKFLLIALMTYIIALGDFTHIVAGSAEMMYGALLGEYSWFHGFYHFFLPTLAGNLMGGTAIFALLSYVQVREEIKA